MELKAMPWHESVIEAELSKTRVLINATSIGLHGDETPVPAELIPPDLIVLDLIYRRTTLLKDAEAAGCTVSDGETMLLHQGAAAFTLWTGRPAPLELMQERLAEARARGILSAEGEGADSEAGDGGAGVAPTTGGTAAKEMSAEPAPVATPAEPAPEVTPAGPASEAAGRPPAEATAGAPAEAAGGGRTG
jgi:hypothetical protein